MLSRCGSSFLYTVIKIDFNYISDRDYLYIDLTYFILENFFSMPYVPANAEIKPGAKLFTNICKE
jgi:hypothetical protein